MKYVKEFLIRKMKLKPLGTLRLGMFETIPGTDCKGHEIIVDGINTGMYVAVEDYYKWLENVINEDMFKDKS